jgi:uncharacterized protein YbjT (DUF2867 family)
MTTLLLVGATGLVGRSVLQQALLDARVRRIVAPARRPLPSDPKLDSPLVDFEQLNAGAPWWSADGVICTLGTTIRKAGSQAAFRKVDYEYPLAVARLTREHGARAFALTSAAGANPHSRLFYNRTKGEIEDAIRASGFPSLTIVRPALIGGNQAEFRTAEFVAMRVLRLIEPALPRRYRVVSNELIARTLLEAAIAAAPGEHIIESEAIGREPG